MTKNRKNGWIFVSFFDKQNETKKATIKDGQTTEKPSAPKREHPTLQKMKLINCLIFFLAISALLDPDTDPGIPLNPDPVHNTVNNETKGYRTHLPDMVT